MINLSICIPTYNFGSFIGETLDSILPQVRADVEVVILDGGSTDETASVVQTMQQNYPQLKYNYQNHRGGIDRDIETVISLSEGKYCWLFSADDIMLPGSIDKVLNAIKANHDIYICEHILCDIEINPILAHPPFNSSEPRLYDLADQLQKDEYFRNARTSEAFFSFLAGPIFKREVWSSVSIPESFYGTCWVVAGHLLASISFGPTVSYLGEILMYKRGDNDSFSDQGIVNRYRIAIETFVHVANTVFGVHSSEAYQIRRVLRQDVSFRHLIKAKLWASKHTDTEDIDVLNRIAKLHYTDAGFKNRIKYMVFRITPIIVIDMVSSIKKYMRAS